MGTDKPRIPDSEHVARLLSRSWVSEGRILHIAFTLREKETYISVNRLAVSSYGLDVSSFINSHPDFYANEEKSLYIRAIINVGDVRNSKIYVDNVELDIDVDVEPRDIFTKSHAGIFTRHGGVTIKKDDTIFVKATRKGISSDQVLLKVRSRLLDISKLETCCLDTNE